MGNSKLTPMKIRNKKTGKIIQVSEKDLAKYGLEIPQAKGVRRIKKAQAGTTIAPEPQDYPDQQSFMIALGEWTNAQQQELQPVQNNGNSSASSINIDNKTASVPGLNMSPGFANFLDEYTFQIGTGVSTQVPLMRRADLAAHGLEQVPVGARNATGPHSYTQGQEIRPISRQEKFDQAQNHPSVEQSMQQAGRDLSQPTKATPKKKKPFQYNGQIGKAATIGLSAIAALIPGQKIENPIVRPSLAYNENPFGTGSNALANSGITLSTTGYKANSKDRNKSKLRIPSNQITMSNVPHPVIGTGSDGSQQIMYPGEDYLFPNAEYVDEQPLAKSGGKIPKSVEIHGKKMSKKQRKFFQDICDMEDGDEIAKKGKKIAKQYVSKSYKDGGELEIENNAFTPISSETLLIGGKPHEEGGTLLKYGNKTVEAEAGEPAFVGEDGSLSIMGNMKNPVTGNKFKTDALKIAKKEAKVNKLMDTALTLVNNTNPYDKWDNLKFNAGNAMMQGARIKSKQLLSLKEHLGDLQQASLALKKEGLETAENGLRIDGIEKAQMGWHSRAKYEQSRSQKTSSSQSVVNPTPEDNMDLETKYTELKKRTEERLTALYPGKSIRVVEKGGRDITSQRGLKGSGASKTSVSLHNMDAAKDYLIYIDGKLQNSADVYKKTLHQSASELGLYHVGDWDAGHIGAVQEGGKEGTFNTLLSKYPSLKNTENYKKTYSYLQDAVTKGQADKDEIRAWKQISGDTKEYKAAKVDYKKYTTSPSKDLTYFGENTVEKEANLSRVVAPKFPAEEKQKGGPNATIQEGRYNWNLNEPKNIPVESDAEGLQFTQILPELYAAATNKPEPVHLQQYNPELFEPYQVSLQDRRNRITSNGRATRQYLQDNAAAQSVLMAQENQDTAAVDAEEFRINQGIANDITNKNVSLLNEAKRFNLGLADTQYTRQSKAKSITKATNQAVLNSVSNKVLQNKLENRTLQVYENLYPHFRYDENYKLNKEGDRAVFNINGGNSTTSNGNNALSVTRDGQGNILRTRESIKSINDKKLEELNLIDKTNNSVSSLFRKTSNRKPNFDATF